MSRVQGLGIGVGAPGLDAPDPSPGAVAWMRNVVRDELFDGSLQHVQVFTARWDRHTAADIRRRRLTGLRDAGADLIEVSRDRIVQRTHDGGTSTLTFHDTEPPEVLM